MKARAIFTRILGCSLALAFSLQVGQVQARERATTATGSGTMSSAPVGISNPSPVSSLNVSFDGELLSSATIGALANDPVIAWGAVRDAAGHSVPGQIWLVVGKNAKAIYYQLGEDHASGSASYSGYEVQTKAVQTQTVLNFGEGAGVPLIGNDQDAFITSTTELYVRSELMEGGMIAQNVDGSPVETDPLLVGVGSIVTIANVPYASSAQRLGAFRLFSADGALLDESASFAIGSGSSPACADFGDSVGDFTESWIGGVSDVYQTAEFTSVGLSAFTAGAAYGPGGLFAGGFFTSKVSRNVLFPLTEGAESINKSVWVPLASELAEGACNLANLGNDLFAGAAIDLLMVESICSMQSVCTRYEERVIGSTSTNSTTQGPDGQTIESIEVHGVTGEECVESSVELVCEEW